MDNIIIRNKRELEKYRDKIFKAKEDYRKMLARMTFEEKIETLIRLRKRANYLKKFKVSEDQK